MSMLGNGRERRNAKDSKQSRWPWGLAVMGKTLGSTAMLTFPLAWSNGRENYKSYLAASWYRVTCTTINRGAVGCTATQDTGGQQGQAL